MDGRQALSTDANTFARINEKRNKIKELLHDNDKAIARMKERKK